MNETPFSRSELMLGAQVVCALGKTRVAVFGTGGVGSWCAEALVRTGVGRLMLVDGDCVAPSNINRQLMATSQTVGLKKVDILAERLKAIAPALELDVRAGRYTRETASTFALETYDYVIDAIDSLDDKAALIRHSLSLPDVTLFSSMGAAWRLKPFAVRQSPFRRVEGDGLARALRQRFKKTGGLPERPFTCVWSDEPPCPPAAAGEPASSPAAGAKGSLVTVTATFGLSLASLVIEDVASRLKSPSSNPPVSGL